MHQILNILTSLPFLIKLLKCGYLVLAYNYSYQKYFTQYLFIIYAFKFYFLDILTFYFAIIFDIENSMVD